MTHEGWVDGFVPATGSPPIADDTRLEVRALGNWPGVYSPGVAVDRRDDTS